MIVDTKAITIEQRPVGQHIEVIHHADAVAQGMSLERCVELLAPLADMVASISGGSGKLRDKQWRGTGWWTLEILRNGQAVVIGQGSSRLGAYRQAASRVEQFGMRYLVESW